MDDRAVTYRPVDDDPVMRLARAIDASVTLWLISGATDQKYSPNEVARAVNRIVWDQCERIIAQESDRG